MTQGVLSFPDRPLSMVARLAQYLTERPNQWIDGRELAQIAGYAAWRTRTSELRYPPFNMDITNRNYRRKISDGRTITVSEYRYRPEE